MVIQPSVLDKEGRSKGWESNWGKGARRKLRNRVRLQSRFGFLPSMDKAVLL